MGSCPEGSGNRVLAVTWKIVALAVLGAPAVFAADAVLSGHVLDENNAPIAGARITLTTSRKSADSTEAKLQATSDPTGAFTVTIERGATYTVRVERSGHFVLEQSVEFDEHEAELTLTVPHQRHSVESVDVAYTAADIDPDRTYPQTLITGKELLDVPYPKTNELRNSLRLLPGVVQDSRGGLHANGGTEEQLLYTLDGFILNDPLTGRLETRLSVEAVRAFELKSGALPAEYGKGASGVLAISTDPGADRVRLTGTNFVPGVEYQKGLIVGGWTPRFGISGPLVKGRAWFSDSLDLQYNKTVIKELRKGEDEETSWRGSNLFRTQVNLTEANVLTAGLLTNFWQANRTGLSPIDPIETTADRRARSYFFNIKDQIAFHRGALIELGFASSRTFGREIPQGDEVLILTPNGTRGNYVMDARRNGARKQILFNTFLPTFTLAGRHQIKAGIDLDRIHYDQDVRRSGFDFLRTDGSLIRKTRFGGNGTFFNSLSLVSSYVQDSWRLFPNLLLELGVRQDWDASVRNATLAPRIGVAWAVGEHTKLAGGFAVVYEPGNLRLFSQPLDQYSITTTYRRPVEPENRVTLTRYTMDNSGLQSPKYKTWNMTLEHELSPQFYLRTGYVRRRGSDGFSYVPHESLEFSPPLLTGQAFAVTTTQRLANQRKDIYDAVELTLRQTFGSRYEWMASYTRSRALSNSVTDVQVDNPILAMDNAGPMPWDTPNRFVSWGYVPTGRKKWSFAYLLEWRTGQPFSVMDEEGAILGPVNQYRYPDFFELNTHLERQISAFGYRWAFRFGVNNLTDHKNRNVVINNISSPQFLQFFGGQRRAFNFRIRWLGKA